MLVFPLHNWILLWSGNTWMLMNNAMFSIKIFYEEFRSIVSSNDCNIGMKLCVNHVTKWDQQRSSVRFWFHEVNPSGSCGIIHNGKEVSETIMSEPSKWSPQWIKLKALSETWLIEGNESCFCFAIGQRTQFFLIWKVCTSRI